MTLVEKIWNSKERRRKMWKICIFSIKVTWMAKTFSQKSAKSQEKSEKRMKGAKNNTKWEDMMDWYGENVFSYLKYVGRMIYFENLVLAYISIIDKPRQICSWICPLRCAVRFDHITFRIFRFFCEQKWRCCRSFWKFKKRFFAQFYREKKGETHC